MIALKRAESIIFLCMEIILQTQISPQDHIVLLDTNLKLNVPHIRIDSESNLATKPLVRKPDIYIADLDQVPLPITIDNFRNKTNFNPRAKFIFITANVTDEYVDSLSEMFISNVIFISPVSGEISTYYPYKNMTIHDMDKEVFIVNNCSYLIGNRGENHILFEEKIPETWNNSLIKFCYLVEPPYSIGPDEEEKGFYLDFFNFVGGKIRLEPIWNSLSYPTNGDLDTYTTDSVKTNDICDLNTGLFPVDGIDHTPPSVFDEQHFFVPAPLQIPRWKYLLKTLTIEIWLFWMFTSFFLSISWVIVYLVLEKKWNTMKLLELLWLNIELFIEKSHDVTKNYLSLRILFFFIVLQSSLINMIFKCNFNLVLSGIIFEKPIESLQDIVDRGIIFGLYNMDELDNILEVLSAEQQKTDLKGEPCDSGNMCFNRTAFERDMAVQQSVRIYRYSQNAYLHGNGSPLMTRIDPAYKEVGLGAVLPLGHPITPAIEKYILISQAYGFNEFFLSRYDLGVVTELPFQLRLMKLTLEHIITPSALLIGGYIVGLAVFIFEMRKSYRNRIHPIFRMK